MPIKALIATAALLAAVGFAGCGAGDAAKEAGGDLLESGALGVTVTPVADAELSRDAEDYLRSALPAKVEATDAIGGFALDDIQCWVFKKEDVGDKADSHCLANVSWDENGRRENFESMYIDIEGLGDQGSFMWSVKTE